MTPEQLAEALEALGLAPEAARRHFPEIREGEDAEAKDYDLVHHPDGRVSPRSTRPDARSTSSPNGRSRSMVRLVGEPTRDLPSVDGPPLYTLLER